MQSSMQRRLARSSQEKMIGGVAGGLGIYFDVDPTWVRLAFVGLFFGAGIGFLLYLALWLVMPSDKVVPGANARFDPLTGQPLPPRAPRTPLSQQERNRMLGMVLLGIGVLMLASSLEFMLPVLLVGGGLYLLRANRII